MFVAIAVHIGLAFWLANLPVPEPEFRSIGVTLLPPAVVDPQPPEIVRNPISSPVEMPPPMLPVDAVVAKSPEKAIALEPVPFEADPAPELNPTAAEILGRMSRYRIDGQSRVPEAAIEPVVRVLGAPPPGNLLAELRRQMPNLPFGDTAMTLEFYPMGARGDVARALDAATQEFGFKTKSGLEVKCVFMWVLLSCGWREL